MKLKNKIEELKKEIAEWYAHDGDRLSLNGLNNVFIAEMKLQAYQEALADVRELIKELMELKKSYQIDGRFILKELG